MLLHADTGERIFTLTCSMLSRTRSSSMEPLSFSCMLRDTSVASSDSAFSPAHHQQAQIL